jgi:hypothetical protein
MACGPSGPVGRALSPAPLVVVWIWRLAEAVAKQHRVGPRSRALWPVDAYRRAVLPGLHIGPYGRVVGDGQLRVVDAGLGEQGSHLSSAVSDVASSCRRWVPAQTEDQKARSSAVGIPAAE